MTQEDKELLLKDLCARVLYHPKGHVVNACNGAECDEWLTCATFPMFTSATNNCRLYLRPMSSITEEERKKFNSLINGVEERCINAYGKGGYTLAFTELNDWLNAHYFDYRGLISKGLALEAPEGMYNVKN